MPSVYVPGKRTDFLTNTASPVSNPTNLMLLINNITYANGYRIDYSGGFRNIFPVYNSSSNTISLICHNIAYGQDLPALSLPTIEVLING
ncbi:hypothetical protein EB001_03040 [bacterium]|nr:hypothetical protein [bacterium]